MNGESGQLPSSGKTRREKGAGNTSPSTSRAPSVGPRRFILSDDEVQVGMSWSAPAPSSGRSNRPKRQGHSKGILGAPGAPGDDRGDSSISIDESYCFRNRDNRSSRRKFSTLSRTLEDIGNENPREGLQDVLEEKKELGLLCRKLSDMEAEKAAGFPSTNTRHTGGEPSEGSRNRRSICQESRLAVPVAKTYSGLNYAHYQSLIRSCGHLFCTRPITYRRDVHKILYGIGLLEGSPSTSWYRYEERFGRLDMSCDAFKIFLLDDLCPPEIRLQEAQKKYREAKQRTGQTVHALVRYLEDFE